MNHQKSILHWPNAVESALTPLLSIQRTLLEARPQLLAREPLLNLDFHPRPATRASTAGRLRARTRRMVLGAIHFRNPVSLPVVRD